MDGCIRDGCILVNNGSLVVAVSNIFWNFHPEFLGKMMFNLTIIFFRWVGSTTNQIMLISQSFWMCTCIYIYICLYISIIDIDIDYTSYEWMDGPDCIGIL